ncbi:Ig-like domain-containing protein [Kitasatospora sp. NPDC092039]|uniref:Ig-like domain-containing protein n=1 Tax=Kitasatospora sp. NPDC092039 TaxID=3364086 RepID=UPI003811C822
MSRQFSRTAAALAVLATGLLTTWNTPLAAGLPAGGPAGGTRPGAPARSSGPASDRPRPEITGPVDGAVLADARPRIGGRGAASGASVEVREGGTALCTAVAGRGGDWSCRPDKELAAGSHVLTPVETTGAGVVLRGDPVKVSVKTVPPSAPMLTVPDHTNDPGLRLTGTGEPGSTVMVVEHGSADDLCITGVPADGRWSCLPVENLTDGKHLLTPVAVDAAGNRTAGPPVALVVDTALPTGPVLTSPAAGETVRVSRPKLAGRADPGVDVLVTARAAAGPERQRRTVLCGATAAFDGSWTCTANRDLADGEQWLTVTATDRAGNGVSGEAVLVRVAAAKAAPDPVAPSTAASAVPSPVAASPTRSASARPSPSSAATAATAVPTGPSAVPSAAPSESATAGPSAATAPAAVATAAPAATTRPVGPSPSTAAVVSATPATAVGASPTAVAAVKPVPEPAGAVGLVGLAGPAGDAGRPLAAPPAEAAQGASGRPGEAGWRGGLAGVLLVLTGLGLITRRVFARRPGAPRR